MRHRWWSTDENADAVMMVMDRKKVVRMRTLQDEEEEGRSRGSHAFDIFYKIVAIPLQAGANIPWGRVLDLALIFLALLSIVLLSFELIVLSPRAAELEDEYRAVLDFDYRTTITVTNHDTVAYHDVQVRVVVDTAAMVARNRLRADGADICFTAADKRSVIPFWVESGMNTDRTVIWVRVPELSPRASRSIYMYHGWNGTDAAPDGDGDATFLFFDTFDRYALGSEWEVVGGEPQRGIIDGELQVESRAQHNCGYATSAAQPLDSGLVLEYAATSRHTAPNGTSARPSQPLIALAGMLSPTVPYSAYGLTLLNSTGLAFGTAPVTNISSGSGAVSALASGNTSSAAFIGYRDSRWVVRRHLPLAPDRSFSYRAEVALTENSTALGVAYDGRTTELYRAPNGTERSNIYCYFITNTTSASTVDWVFVRRYSDNLTTMTGETVDRWYREGAMVNELIYSIHYIDLIVCELFFIEFFIKTTSSEHPRRYIKSHWNDILAMIPLSHPALGALNWLRVIRLFVVITRVKRGYDILFGEGATRRLIRRYKNVLADEISALVMIKIIEKAEAELKKERYQHMIGDITRTVEARREQVKELVLDMIDSQLDKMTVTRLAKQIPFVQRQIRDGVEDAIDSAMDMLRNEELNAMIMDLLRSILAEAKRNFARSERRKRASTERLPREIEAVLETEEEATTGER